MEDYNENGRIEVTDFIDKKLNDKEMKKIAGDKHFSICLMNPPYNGTMHLEFLEKVIKISNKVVSIEPCEFILRPYKKSSWEKLKDKYKTSIGKHLKDLEVVGNIAKVFGIGMDIDTGIYVCDENGGFDYDNYYKEYDKATINAMNMFKTNKTLKDVLEKYNNHKYFVPIRVDGNCERWSTLQLVNYLDIIVDGKIYSGEYKGLTIPEARSKNPRENPRNINRATPGISFNTLEEAINFRNSTKLEAYLYIILNLKSTRSNPLNKIPLLDSYKEKWTNKKIFDLFNIDESIRDKIIDLMEPFTKPTKHFNDTFKIVKEKISKLNEQ